MSKMIYRGLANDVTKLASANVAGTGSHGAKSDLAYRGVKHSGEKVGGTRASSQTAALIYRGARLG
ncbi:MAG: hypothetical protein AAFV45_13835 [Pseudomonadota bacterium]